MADLEPPHPPRTAAKPKHNRRPHKKHHAHRKGAPLDKSARARHGLHAIVKSSVDENQSGP